MEIRWVKGGWHKSPKCLKKFEYHDPIRLWENLEAIKEWCRLCGVNLVYYKRDGKTDNKEYYNDHIRDFAQPYGSTAKVFYRIYGKRGRASVRYAQSLLAGVKSKDTLRREWDETLKDSQREMKRMGEDGVTRYY